RKPSRGTRACVPPKVPECLRQREQWQLLACKKGCVTSKRTPPQRQLPVRGSNTLAVYVRGYPDPAMSDAVENLIQALERSYGEAQERMSDPAVFSDRQAAAEAGRRLKELEGPYKLAQEWRSTHDDLEAARDDAELRGLVPELEGRLAELEDELKLALVERDPNDEKDVIVEIRKGAGGDEAAIWAGDLFRMLTRYAESRGFKWEVLGSNPSESGGYNDITFAIKGEGAYSIFKWEGGTHRVQRVPVTESQGRIHTSTA